MDPWDEDDEPVHSGYDVYLGDEDEVAADPEDLMEDDADVTGQNSGAGITFEGLNEQRQNILNMLGNAFISIVPASQEVVDDPNGEPTASLSSSLTIEQVRMLLEAARARGLRAALQVEEDEDEEEDEDYVPDENDEDEDDDIFYGSSWPWNRRQVPVKNWFKSTLEPQKAGVELMNSGDFGRIKAKKRENIRHILKEREMGMRGRGRGLYKEDLSREMVPNTDGTIVSTYGSNAYSGQFSADSSFYYTCCQDWYLHVYDTKAPIGSVTRDAPQPSRRWRFPDTGHETTMKTIQTVNAVPGAWTITDSHLSPDNERLIYSSICSTVYMTKIFEPEAQHIPLRFGARGRGRLGWDDDTDAIGIYSCRFSADGNEVIAGGNGHAGEIRVYDLLANKRTISINAHGNDVNSCCWADSASGNILISASDDTFIKVWDRRSLGSNQKPSGVFVGHTEGITYVSAKGDGRYIVSNGKDQAMRLWDLRKMHSNSEFEQFEHDSYSHRAFDYRYGSYPKPKYKAHPRDCSVMTYRGHQVFRTLIRCHFSPIETTGANYLYTGSSDGKIHIYSLDGRIVQVLNRSGTLPMSFDPSESEPRPTGGMRAPVCVRDVSWHSQEPVLMSVAWENGELNSSVARHEWKGIGKLGDQMARLEDYVERQKRERDERAKRRAARQGQSSQSMPGSYVDDDEEEDE